jgi:hypothetical protein
MLLHLLLWALVGLTFATPKLSTQWTTFAPPPDASEKLGERFSYHLGRDILRRTLIPERDLPSSLSKQDPSVKPRSPGSTMPFRFGQARTILVNISAGSPPQEMEVVLDTGSDFT